MDMAAPELDVRGRTRERDEFEEEDETTTSEETETETPAVKRRKLEEEVDGESTIICSPCVQVQLTNSGEIAAKDLAETPKTSIIGHNSVEDQCQSPNSDNNIGSASTSCCSSNGLSEKLNARIELVDLEVKGDKVAETGTSRRYRRSTRCKKLMYSEEEDKWESMSSAAEWCGRSKVTEAEVEEFFTAAEKETQKKIYECSRKYNFDFVKEEALDGRYEWVQLKH